MDETEGDKLSLQQIGGWKTSQQAEHYGQIRKDRARDAVRKADKKCHLKLVSEFS